MDVVSRISRQWGDGAPFKKLKSFDESKLIANGVPEGEVAAEEAFISLSEPIAGGKLAKKNGKKSAANGSAGTNKKINARTKNSAKKSSADSNISENGSIDKSLTRSHKSVPNLSSACSDGPGGKKALGYGAIENPCYFDNEGNFYRIDNGHHHSNKKAGVGTGDADTQFGDEQLNGIKRIQKSLLKASILMRHKIPIIPQRKVSPPNAADVIQLNATDEKQHRQKNASLKNANKQKVFAVTAGAGATTNNEVKPKQAIFMDIRNRLVARKNPEKKNLLMFEEIFAES